VIALSKVLVLSLVLIFLLLCVKVEAQTVPEVPSYIFEMVVRDILKSFLLSDYDLMKPKEYLVCSGYIDCDNPKVISVAKGIELNCTNHIPLPGFSLNYSSCTPDVLALYDMYWTHSYITFDYNYIWNWVKASEILDVKRGVCSHYAILYCAITRAQGIPCKPIVGYRPGSYIGHEWNEVWIYNWTLADSRRGVWDKDAYSDLEGYPCYKPADWNTTEVYYQSVPYWTCIWNYTYTP